jgi:uncharacterized peroxidase-related enzyme
MSWLKAVSEEQATGELKAFYKDFKEKRGKIANIVTAQSLNPAAMKDNMGLYLTLVYGQSDLTREQRELLATVVSAFNGSRYCVSHHAFALNHFWKDEAKLQKLIKNYKAVPLPEKDRKMLDFAVKLTETPGKIRETDIDILKKGGYKDRDILDIILLTGYFNMLSRIADGLGVEVSAAEAQGYKY